VFFGGLYYYVLNGVSLGALILCVEWCFFRGLSYYMLNGVFWKALLSVLNDVSLETLTFIY
jgi:hypothetical protein